MKVYFISGLAADRRIFKYISLPEGFEAVFIDWIHPQPNETLRNYALRLAHNIDPREPFVLAGLSLGGMIAVEIAKQYRPYKLILISSIPCPTHLPYYFRWIGKLKLHRIVPTSLLKSASLVKRFFTTETSADKTYLRQAIRESDPRFIRWAVNAILDWKEKSSLSCYHIHGSDDLLLPTRFTKPTHIVKGGGHMMVMNRHEEINRIFREILLKPEHAAQIPVHQ